MKDYFFPGTQTHTHNQFNVCAMHVLAVILLGIYLHAHMHHITSSVNLNIKRINAFLIFDVNKMEIFLFEKCANGARVMCLLSYDENVLITIIS